MKKRNIVFLLALTGAVYVALKNKKQAEAPAATGGATPSATVTEAPIIKAPIIKTPMAEPVVHVVEETLHRHEGEDNPIVHAFEEALEQKAAHADTSA